MTAPTSAQDAARQEVRIKGAVDRLRRHGYPTEADMIEAQQQEIADLRRRLSEARPGIPIDTSSKDNFIGRSDFNVGEYKP